MPLSISLLPQSPNSLLHSPRDRLRILKLKKILIDEAILAVQDFFIYKCIDRFDGHVGETLCQIRAYYNYLLRSNLYRFYRDIDVEKQVTTLEQVSNKIFALIKDYQYWNHQREKYQSLNEFLQEKNVICDMPELIIYLTQLHLLSRFKMFNTNEDASIDYRKMCNALGISKHTARYIIHLYQINISKKSVDFIYSLLANKNNNITLNLFESLRKIDDDCRFTLPCYWVMDILYDDMLREKCPILVVCKRRMKHNHIDTIFLLFKVSPVTKEYEYYPFNKAAGDDLYFTVVGFADYSKANLIPDREQYTQNFISYGVRNILFANMAIHPQYSGRKLSQDKDTPFLNLLEEKKNIVSQPNEQMTLLKLLHRDQQVMSDYAQRIGCFKANPILFYIRHIFCDTLNNQQQLNKLYEKKREDIILEALPLGNAFV